MLYPSQDWKACFKILNSPLCFDIRYSVCDRFAAVFMENYEFVSRLKMGPGTLLSAVEAKSSSDSCTSFFCIEMCTMTYYTRVTPVRLTFFSRLNENVLR